MDGCKQWQMMSKGYSMDNRFHVCLQIRNASMARCRDMRNSGQHIGLETTMDVADEGWLKRGKMGL